MRRLSIALIATVSTVALTQFASAADLPRKAPAYTPPPPPAYSWTGFYVGGNVGYSWGNAQTDLSNSVIVVESTLAGPFTNPPNVFANSSKQHLNGVVGGGQIGFNYQFNPNWVLGFEFDFQGSGERNTTTVSDPFSGTICTTLNLNIPPTCAQTAPTTGAATTTYDAKIDWFGTARGRLGFLATDQLLLYVTGGLAYGEVKLSGVTSVSQSFLGTLLPTVSNAFSASKTNVGWTVGGGIEGKFSGWLSPAWSWKLEYLYIDLGSLDALTLAGPSATLSTLTTSIGNTTTHTHFTDNIVRVGLNYKFH